MNFIDDGFAVDIGRTRLARALCLGPLGSLILTVLGKADTVEVVKGVINKGNDK